MPTSDPIAQPALPTSVRTHDVDDQAVALRGWTQRYQQLSHGRFNGELSSVQFSRVEVFFESSNQHLHQVGAPPCGKVVLGLPLHAKGHGWLAGSVFDRDSVIAVDADDEFSFRTPHELLLGALVCEKEHLMTVASELGVEGAIQATLSAGYIHLEDGIADGLRRFFDDIRAGLISDRLCDLHATKRIALADAVLHHWLCAFKEVETQQRPFTQTRRQRRDLAMEAHEYLATHVCDLPDVAGLCRILNVQERVLQYCFREVYGLPPNAFIRNMRLHEVRRAIRADVRQQESIGDIACRWDFWHLSRFASDYRQLFGERPSETRRISCALA